MQEHAAIYLSLSLIGLSARGAPIWRLKSSDSPLLLRISLLLAILSMGLVLTSGVLFASFDYRHVETALFVLQRLEDMGLQLLEVDMHVVEHVRGRGSN